MSRPNMSTTCERFITAVQFQDWGRAYTNLNGLNMYEMVRSLAEIDRADLDDLWGQRTTYGAGVTCLESNTRSRR